MRFASLTVFAVLACATAATPSARAQTLPPMSITTPVPGRRAGLRAGLSTGPTLGVDLAARLGAQLSPALGVFVEPSLTWLPPVNDIRIWSAALAWQINFDPHWFVALGPAFTALEVRSFGGGAPCPPPVETSCPPEYWERHPAALVRFGGEVPFYNAAGAHRGALSIAVTVRTMFGLPNLAVFPLPALTVGYETY